MNRTGGRWVARNLPKTTRDKLWSYVVPGHRFVVTTGKCPFTITPALSRHPWGGRKRSDTVRVGEGDRDLLPIFASLFLIFCVVFKKKAVFITSFILLFLKRRKASALLVNRLAFFRNCCSFCAIRVYFLFPPIVSAKFSHLARKNALKYIFLFPPSLCPCPCGMAVIGEQLEEVGGIQAVSGPDNCPMPRWFCAG